MFPLEKFDTFQFIIHFQFASFSAVLQSSFSVFFPTPGLEGSNSSSAVSDFSKISVDSFSAQCAAYSLLQSPSDSVDSPKHSVDSPKPSVNSFSAQCAAYCPC